MLACLCSASTCIVDLSFTILLLHYLLLYRDNYQATSSKYIRVIIRFILVMLSLLFGLKLLCISHLTGGLAFVYSFLILDAYDLFCTCWNTDIV